MPLKTFKRGQYYYIRGTVKGRSVYESTGETKKDAAEQIRIRKENDLLRVARGEKTFTEAAIAYIERGGEKTYIEAIDDVLGHYPLSEITQEILDTKAREAYPTQSNASVQRWFYNPFCAVINNAARLKWIPNTKYDKPTVKRPPPDWAEMDWFEKLWEKCNPKLLALTTFLPYTGCRIGECLALTWDNVNLEEGRAYIPKTKNGEPRTVFLPNIVIERLKAIQDAGQVFKYSSRHVVRNELKRACKAAKIDYKRPHAIGSHTYATWMRRYGGLDAVGLVATGRWKDPRSTYIYTHAKATDEAKKASLLPVPSGAKSVQTSDK